MGWLNKWFDDTDWPKDPRLDEFRDAVSELSLDGEPMGWVTAGVAPMRSFPFLWLREECMWTQVHWLSGEHEYLEEDYGPEWHVAEELATRALCHHRSFNQPGSNLRRSRRNGTPT